MKNIIIDKNTLEYTLHLLDTQCEHIKTFADNGAAQRRQMAYYQGMYTMLNTIVQKAFTDDTRFLWVTAERKHYIYKKAGEENIE